MTKYWQRYMAIYVYIIYVIIIMDRGVLGIDIQKLKLNKIVYYKYKKNIYLFYNDYIFSFL